MNELDPVIHVDPAVTAPEGEPDTGSTKLEEVVPTALKAVDPEKLAALREKLKKISASAKKTESGSEAPTEGAPPETGQVMTGKDVDWSEYELDFAVKHFYPGAMFRMTPQGPKWVAMVDEFYSTSRQWRQHGKRVNVPGGREGIDVEPLNLGQYLNDMLNSPEGWRLVSVLPATGGDVGILLQRQVPVILPDPQPLKKATEVEAPKDPELQRTEDAALTFMGKEGLTTEALVGEDRASGSSLESLALSINPSTERDPGSIDNFLNRTGSLSDVKEAAGEASAALAGADFGEVPSPQTEE